jgi:uncharacterized protein YceK
MSGGKEPRFSDESGAFFISALWKHKKRGEAVMVKKALMVVLVPLLAGCGKTIWYHPTKTEADFQRGKYECEKIAEQSATNWGSKGDPFMMYQEMMRCMQSKFGWTPRRE